MKLLQLALILFPFLASILNSNAQDAIAKNDTSSLLWEISGKKVKSPSYIFGTMHLIPKEQFLFPESLQDKLKKSDVLVMEIGGLSEQMKAMQLLMLEEGNLFDHFSEEQEDSVLTYAEENLGYTEEQIKTMFGKMKPFVLMQLITKESFGDEPASYEMSLEQIAKSEEIKVEGLETVEEQMALFDKIPNDEQVEMVMSSLRSADSSKSETQRLIDAYLSQDIDSIYGYTQQSDMGVSSFEEDFITKRNQKWIPAIKKIIRKEKAFIAVGAAHLGGPNGVIELLRKEGYTLTPVEL